MTKKWWIVGVVVVVVAALGLYFGPKIYASLQEDDAPAASVSTSGAQAASTESIDGRWIVTPGDAANATAAGYTVDELLNGSDVTVVGSTTEVSGNVVIADDTLTEGQVVVMTNSITTDSDRRDSQFRGNIFETAAYPTATFDIDSPIDLSSLPKDGTTQTVTAEGTLTLKDQTRPVSVQMEVLQSGDTLIASGAIPTTWADYGIEPPSLGFVTVEGSGTVDFLINLSQQ
ncbi:MULTISPECIES: YceI family protein [Rhodococcus]|jgi:polyisoprenoid-binding protein YceI|uniref:YceI family protein n=1 Tax=Rhodococcus cercidiphylli TaxID=489916 RepID=A0ABU4B1T0_9NOCA|nr:MULTISPECIES: YceI family protein [Rhodococcus]MDI6627911.1 YceI family protein [Rhodococcus sp. (in: high G+C Gram-positive bacteria)]MDV6232406.1 YceI family protein [Rhodococcus cercidiphylli]MDV8058229.1 YceI family protein [Rhodococcus sp. IEGM 1343]MDV8079414.1 YceI family protein [Rhodococcus sp. IEGM 1370]